jgi:Cys-tRNA(Pro)/Cys-tRNA(Cys) deacylase
VAHKTNAMRFLDARGIAYSAVSYSPALHSGDEVAAAIGQPAARVFKTLVAIANAADWILVMVPSDRELSLKRCAAAIGAKRIRMATRKEAEAKTGLLAGGISPLALTNKPFTVYLDRHARAWDAIYVSAGQRGYNLLIAVDDLLAVTRATLIDAVDDVPGVGKD